MLNYIWPIFIIISVIYALISGNIDSLCNGIFDYSKKAVDLSITFLGTMCLWSGLIEIIKNTSLLKKIKILIRPFMKFVFPNLKTSDKEYEEISMNIIANFLGIGNASTPLGIKAIKIMQEKNNKKEVLSDNMAMFIVLNTASIQLIPTTVIAIRNSLNSVNPTKIILPVWIVTMVAAFGGIFISKLFIKLGK